MIRKYNKATSDAGAITSSAINAGGNIATAAIESANPLGWIGSVVDGISNVIGGVLSSITSLGNTRNNNSATTAQLYWLTARDGNDEQQKNSGFYIIIGLMVIAVVVVIIMNNKNTK